MDAKLQLTSCPVCQGQQLAKYIDSRAQMHRSEKSFRFDRCSDCGTVMLNPRLGPEDLDDYYQAAYLPYRGPQAWGRYSSQVAGSQEKLDRRRARWIHKLQPLNTDTLILDIGCGQPSFLQQCREKYGARGIGIDFSDHGWQGAEEKYGDLDLRVSELPDLHLQETPNVITMWHYLEHDYHPDQTLRRIAEISSDDTLMVIEVPDHASQSRQIFGSQWAGYHTPRHTFLFNPENITTLLQNTGWNVVDFHPNGTLDPYNLYWLSKMEQKGIDWEKSMEQEFWGYVRGMLAFNLANLFRPVRPHGVMTIMARRDPSS